jgi:hypothetical protein
MTLSLRYQYSRNSNESLPYFANRVNVSGDAGINGNDQDPRNWGPPGSALPATCRPELGLVRLDEDQHAGVGGGLFTLPR